MNDSDQLERAASILGHPMQRATDPLLASAVLAPKLPYAFAEAGKTIGMGRIPAETGRSLTEGLEARQPNTVVAAVRRAADAIKRLFGAGPMAEALEIDAKTWRLNRHFQLDQGQTPHCVAYTVSHWRLSQPIYTSARKSISPAEFYARCKERDGWPGVDGTTAWAALSVATDEGVVASHWWWNGPAENDAARTWLQTVGPMWYGVFLPESFFRTSREIEGLAVVDGPLLYGHEMLVIGWVKNYKGQGPCYQILNSWGESWGVRGRCFIREADFYRMLEDSGDLVGVIERRAAA